MPRSGVNGTYSLPPNTNNQAPNTPISSSMFNAFASDVQQTFNDPTPVAYGGTGASDAAGARANINALGPNETADRAFRQGNILGTVSQSAGVPTGAIIERGSNANGEYVRFADGTQIAEFVAAGIDLTAGTSQDFTAPVSFEGSRAYAGLSARFSGVAALQDVYKLSVGNGGDTWRIRNNGANFSAPQTINLFMYGRWF